MDAVKKYGLLSGLAFVLWQYIEYFTGMQQSGFAAYTGFLPVPLFILFLFMAIRKKRGQQGGYLEFTDGLKTGLGVSAIAGVMYSISQYIYNKWIDTSLAVTEAEKLKEYLLKHGKSAVEAQAEVAQIISAYPFRTSVETLAFMIFFGAIITLVFSATMKKNPPAASV